MTGRFGRITIELLFQQSGARRQAQGMNGERPSPFLGVHKFSSPRSLSGISPTAHPVGEEAWFEAGALRPHQTMAFCCKQRQGSLPGAPSSLSLSLSLREAPHTHVHAHTHTLLLFLCSFWGSGFCPDRLPICHKSQLSVKQIHAGFLFYLYA